MEQTTLEQPSTKNVDMLRTLLHLTVAEMYIEELLVKNPDIGSSIKNGTQRTLRELVILKRKLLNKTDNQCPWMRNVVDKDKLWDVGALVDLMFRVGSEEEAEDYDEFLSLVMNCIKVVFYPHKNRRDIYFPKYKALFNLFIEEVQADVNKLPGRFVMQNNNFFIKMHKLNQPIQLNI